jgi:energy-coupling factor transporter transmembrane protein EcfT
MLVSKGRLPVTTSTHRVDRRLWLVSFVLIVAIVAVGIIVNRGSPSHVASPVVVRLAAAAIVTACAAVAKFVAGPRAAAATAVLGTLIAVVLLIQLG